MFPFTNFPPALALLLGIGSFAVSVAVSVWMKRDAESRCRNGNAWGFAFLFLGVLVAAFYLIVRNRPFERDGIWIIPREARQRYELGEKSKNRSIAKSLTTFDPRLGMFKQQRSEAPSDHDWNNPRW